ncbi:hypothetical protein TNCV_4025571 [Trichonephila clavipes]|nr:hypothetical protein TNCV_4025571 [Trichonephila clavipes]
MSQENDEISNPPKGEDQLTGHVKITSLSLQDHFPDKRGLIVPYYRLISGIRTLTLVLKLAGGVVVSRCYYRLITKVKTVLWYSRQHGTRLAGDLTDPKVHSTTKSCREDWMGPDFLKRGQLGSVPKKHDATVLR